MRNKLHPVEKILNHEIRTFLDDVFFNLNLVDIDVSKFPLDHVCYRTATYEGYNILKRLLLDHSKLLSENEIGGRPIAVLKLNKPFEYKNRKIDCLELPAPKPGKPYGFAFEHAEFVIDDNLSLKDFMTQHPLLPFDTSGLSRDGNPDVALKFTDCSVKFHKHSLEHVVKYIQK